VRASGSIVLPGAADDPAVYGGRLRVFDTALGGAGEAVFELPASGWEGPAGSKGFRFSGGGCKKVRVTPGRITIVCQGGVTLSPPFAADCRRRPRARTEDDPLLRPVRQPHGEEQCDAGERRRLGTPCRLLGDRPDADTDAAAHPATDPHLHVDPGAGNADRHADPHSDRHGDQHTDGDADQYGHLDVDADANGDEYADAHSDADGDQHADGNADQNGDSDADADENPDRDADWYADRDAHPDTDGDTESDVNLHPEQQADEHAGGWVQQLGIPRVRWALPRHACLHTQQYHAQLPVPLSGRRPDLRDT
jgi:hypothetical protein